MLSIKNKGGKNVRIQRSFWKNKKIYRYKKREKNRKKLREEWDDKTFLFYRYSDFKYRESNPNMFKDFSDEEIEVLKKIIKNDALRGQNSLVKTNNNSCVFGNETIINTLWGLKDPDLTKLYLEMSKQHGHLTEYKKTPEGYSFFQIRTSDLLTQIGDEEYTRQFIEEYTQTCDTTEQDKMRFISVLSRENQGKYDSYIYEKYKPKDKNLEEFDLPEGMTIGMEIEAAGCFYHEVPVLYGWQAKGDSTIKNDASSASLDGTEVVSPILKGSSKDVEDLYTTCNILRDCGAYVNSSCGGHIHIGADYLKGDSKENLIALWGNTEEVLYKICNEKGDKLRGIYHAKPISSEIQQRRDDWLIKAYESSYPQNDDKKYRSMSAFRNIPGRNTVEFRIANSSLDPKVWIQNANLYGGMVAAADKLDEIMQKEDGQRTEDEQAMLANFQTLCTEECSEEQKLNILLNLAIRPEKRYIYEERYAANSPLIEEDKELHDKIVKGVAQKPLMPRTLAKTLFTGPNRVKGQDMQAAEQRLNRDVERSNIQQQENLQAK